MVTALLPKRERWSFDGWELTSSTAHDWEYRSGTDQVAGMVGTDPTVPLRDGALWRRRTHGPGQFELQVVLRGDDPGEVRDNWNTLLRATTRRNRPVKVIRTLYDGERITCEASVTGTIQPTHLGRRGMRAAITFTVPAGWWTSVQDFAYSHTGAGSNKFLSMPAFAQSTAPMDLTYEIRGPISVPSLVDYTGNTEGERFVFYGNIPSGATLVVNSATWEIDQAGPGFSPSANQLTYTGNRYLSMEPAVPGQTPTLWLSGNNTGSQTRLKAYGRRAYLT